MKLDAFSEKLTLSGSKICQIPNYKKFRNVFSQLKSIIHITLVYPKKKCKGSISRALGNFINF
jgi:hypothetical protein